MIREYALEPELVASWSNREDYRYFIDKFGIGTPRAVSAFPKTWVERVWNCASLERSLDHTRMVELLRRLKSCMVDRPSGSWNQEKAWLDNAIDEHECRNFHAILARNTPKRVAPVLSRADLEKATSELWIVEDRKRIPRTTQDICAAASPLLSISRRICLIDRYFRASPDSKWMGPTEGFLKAAFENRSTGQVRVEIHCSADYDRAPASMHFKKECISGLSRLIPKGQSLHVIRWNRRTGGEDFHDRHILTEIGGLLFSVGLDEGDSGKTTAVHILSKKEYELLWQQYLGPNPAFDPPKGEEPVDVEGKGQ